MLLSTRISNNYSNKGDRNNIVDHVNHVTVGQRQRTIKFRSVHGRVDRSVAGKSQQLRRRRRLVQQRRIWLRSRYGQRYNNYRSNDDRSGFRTVFLDLFSNLSHKVAPQLWVVAPNHARKTIFFSHLFRLQTRLKESGGFIGGQTGSPPPLWAMD